MIYLLFTSLLIMFVISYYLAGKDFFAPAVVQILTFVGSVFMSIYFMWSMECPYDFHWETIGIIMSAMALSMVLGVIIHWIVRKIRVYAHTPESVRISPISNEVSFLMIGVEIITIIWLLAEIWRIGGVSGNFFATMVNFHSIHSYSTKEEGKFPWLLNQLISLTQVFFLLYGFNLIRFFKELTVWRRGISLLIISLCSLTLLLTGGRSSTVNLLIACFMMFHLLRIQRQKGYKTYPLKSLVRLALLLLLILAAFFLTKSLVGRNSRNETMNGADYIAYYVGSGYITFDEYLQNPPMPSNIFGKETFYNMISFLINYGFIDIPRYIVHLEFRPVGAGFSTNVYTFLRSYHYDFGIVGIYFLHGISIVFLSVFYEYVKKKRGNIGILIFSMMYYSIVLSFFAERFFANIVSANFIKMSVELVILYELFIRKRVKVGIRRQDMISFHLNEGQVEA